MTTGFFPNSYLDLVISGTDANKPTSPLIPTGRFAFYYATDTNILYKWNGTSWDSTAPAAQAVGASLSAKAIHGSIYLLNTASGSVLTLPASTGSGLIICVGVTTTTTSGAHKVLTAPTTDVLIGNVSGQNGNTAKSFSAASASGFHSLQMPFAGSQPSGGFEGDWFDLQDIAAGKWLVSGLYQAGTVPTTPFSTATT